MIKTIRNKDKILYTLKHKKAFLLVEKELLGKNTIRGYLHNLDKVVLCLLFPYPFVKKFHRNYSRHHDRAKTRGDRIQQIIDWECARYTKKDKPLNARDTLYKLYPQLISTIKPLLEELGL